MELQELCLCMLVHFFVHPPATPSVNGRPGNARSTQKELARFILGQLNAPGSVLYPSLPQLFAQLVERLGGIGQELCRQLHAVLTGLATPDDITRLFDAFEVLLVSEDAGPGGPAGVHPSSPLGLFLRRCRLSFRRMPYEAVAALHTSVLKEMEQQAGGAGAPPEEAAALLRRLRQPVAVDALLARRIRELDLTPVADADGSSGAETGGAATGSATPGGGTVSDAALEAALAGMDLPGALQLQLATALKARDFTAAVDALHRAYDYAQAGSGPRARYQHALLALSDLHATFGHTHEALNALSEALGVAQQTGDQAALSHCLVSLHQLAESAPGAPGLPELQPGGGGWRSGGGGGGHTEYLTQLLLSCLSRGTTLRSPQLCAFARLGLVRCAMQHSARELGGECAEALRQLCQQALPLQCARAQQDISRLHHAAALDAVCASPVPGADAPGQAGHNPAMALYSEPSVHAEPGSVGAAAARDAVIQLAGSAHLLQSHAWLTGGSLTLAHLHATIHAACFSRASTAEDSHTATALLLQAVNRKQGLSSAISADAGQEGAPKLVGVGSMDGGDGDAASARTLDQCSKPLIMARLSLKHQAHLSSGQLRHAAMVVDDMACLIPHSPHLEVPLRLEVRNHHVATCLASGRLPEAYECANELFCLACHVGLQVEAMQALFSLAQVHLAAGNTGEALPYVLSTLLHATAWQHDVLAADALLVLVTVWVQLCPSAAPEARQLVQEVIPLVAAAGRHELVVFLPSCLTRPSSVLADAHEVISLVATTGGHELVVFLPSCLTRLSKCSCAQEEVIMLVATAGGHELVVFLPSCLTRPPRVLPCAQQEVIPLVATAGGHELMAKATRWLEVQHGV
ncbi:hypothetical protein FOA52_003346 [Chlamydomonas sp. UWO 241]|nr:hypothetical protein FOA52_003346 [Chlamydomonas sp. UWO 241]